MKTKRIKNWTHNRRIVEKIYDLGLTTEEVLDIYLRTEAYLSGSGIPRYSNFLNIYTDKSMYTAKLKGSKVGL